MKSGRFQIKPSGAVFFAFCGRTCRGLRPSKKTAGVFFLLKPSGAVFFRFLRPGLPRAAALQKNSGRFFPVKALRRGFFSLFAAGLAAGCGPPKKEGAFFASQGRPRDFYEARKQSDSNRKETLSRSREIYKSSQSCKKTPSCGAACGRLFQYPSDRRDCRQLSPPQVRRFEDVYAAFQDKSRESLSALAFFDIKAFLNLSAEPSVTLFGRFGRVAAKEFLSWILADWEIALLFSEEDQDFIFLETLLREIEVYPIKALEEPIEGDMTFQELALRKQNDPAMVWVHEFFAKSLCGGAGEAAAAAAGGGGGPALAESQAECVLARYCPVAARFSEELLGALKGFQRFKEALGQAADKKCFGELLP